MCRMLAEGTGGGGQGLGGPTADHRGAWTPRRRPQGVLRQEKPTTCTLRPHGAGWGRAEAQRPARRRPLGERRKAWCPQRPSLSPS